MRTSLVNCSTQANLLRFAPDHQVIDLLLAADSPHRLRHGIAPFVGAITNWSTLWQAVGTGLAGRALGRQFVTQAPTGACLARSQVVASDGFEASTGALAQPLGVA